MGWFTTYLRRRSIRRLAKKLSPLLKRDYGKSPPYTPEQIQATMGRNGFPERDLLFALALLSDPQAFDRVESGCGEDTDLDAARVEVADSLFDGDYNFGTSDVEAALTSHTGGWHSFEGADSFNGDGGLVS